MLNIAILGTDSTHSNVYGELLNFSNKFPSAKINSIWGENYSQTVEKGNLYKIKEICKNPEQAISNSDFSIVC